MADYSDLELQRMLEQAYGIGASDMAAVPAAPDPRVTEMYEAHQMAQYDATVAGIVNANPDIRAERFHQYVAAANGNWDLAVQMYRDDTQQVLEEYGRASGAAPLPGETFAPAGYAPDPNASPKDNLNRAIEEATRAALARRGR